MKLPAELEPALLQTVITLGLALMSWMLYRRYRKTYFAWFTIAWVLYSLRLAAIMEFLVTRENGWLWWHQVLTGWTGVALLWSALAFAFQARWRARWIAVFLFPLLWSYVAIYRFDNFLLAAIPAVAFLSGVTLGTGWVFFRHWRRVRSPGALMCAIAFGLWGLHHLDYPFLRAQGAWVPWGYYLDILFQLSVVGGMLMLVLDDLQLGLRTLSTLTAGAPGDDADPVGQTLQRPLALPTVRGSALFTSDREPGHNTRCVAGAGVCAGWEAHRIGDVETAVVARALESGRPQYERDWRDPVTSRPFKFVAVLPLFPSAEATRATSALVIVGDARDPFAALDERFLLALGHQTGRAIERDELRRRLEQRTGELERLSIRMIEQHEEERRRVSLELHDETAQVLSTVKMQIGMIREVADPALDRELERALALIDEGISSIRSVTQDLRPSLLDDLGLLPALRSLVAGFVSRGTLAVTFEVGDTLPSLAPDAELALFRAVQELLANAARHAGASRVTVRLGPVDDDLVLRVEDDGVGLPDLQDLVRLERQGHLGLAGVRERITALGGDIELGRSRSGGASVIVRLPVPSAMGAA